MRRVNHIIENELYQSYMKKIEIFEKDRLYCKHGFDHAIAVARIGYIYLLEQGYNISKENVYAAGLLHDIGRWIEYEIGEDHAKASARLAQKILEEADFKPVEVEEIVLGIREHRLHNSNSLSPLGRALALADDWARDCRNCSMQGTCHKFSKSMVEVLY